MRILLIRHGDPDYEHDTLTEKGRREAELLAKRASSLRWEVVISLPWQGDGYGTACLKATGKDAEVLEWLREFPAQLDLNKDPELSRAYPGAKMADGKYLIRNVWDMHRDTGQSMKNIWIAGNGEIPRWQNARIWKWFMTG